MGKSTIDKLRESGKLEFHATVTFNLKDDVMDSLTARQTIYNLMGDLYRKNLNIFESIEMDLK